jgi:hypothetical protein
MATLIGALIQTGPTHCHKVMGDDAPANASVALPEWGLKGHGPVETLG